MDKFLLRLPTDLKTKLEEIAKQDRRSLNTQLIIAAEQFVNSHNVKIQESQNLN